MMENDLPWKIYSFVRKNLLIIIIAVAGVICLGYGLIALSGSPDSSGDIIIQSQENNLSGNTSAATSNVAGARIKADIEGAVVRPGVYELSPNSRIQDLLVAGAGLSGNADRVWVAKNLNLAAKLTDGAKVYVPALGENIQASGQLGSVNSGLININTANSQELDSLPGIGPATAEKIINNRPYQSLDELVLKKAVGSKVFENIKDKIILY